MTTEPHKYKRRDYRCLRCGRLAFKAYLPEETIVNIRCGKCGSMLTFNSNGKKVNLEMTEKETRKETPVG